MWGDDEAAALAHDHGMLDLLGVADLHDVVDDVAGVFVQAVVARAVEAGTGAVVVDTESAADVEVAERVPHFTELRVEAGGLAGGAADRLDIGHL